MTIPRSLRSLTLIFGVLFTNVYTILVNISPQSVPVALIQSAINSFIANSPNQRTYTHGNLISAQKLLEPGLVIYRLTLNLNPVCSGGTTSCPQEACAIDVKDRSRDVEIDINSIQCMYLYPQSAQEDMQQVQQTGNVAQDTVQASNNSDHDINGSKNTLKLDREVEAATNSQNASPKKPFISVTAPSSNYSRDMLEQASYPEKERLFNVFTAKYNKTYSSESERMKRFEIFNQNMIMAQVLQRNERGTAVYGASIFSDLATEEFKTMYLGLKPELRLDNELPNPMAEIPDIQIPDEYDWRDYGVVTPVKDQSSCSSCWAFSVTGNVEGQYALKNGNLLSFSEQELIDCDTLDGGCNGGNPDNAYRAIQNLGGLELESDYPYDGKNETCHFDKNEAKVEVVSAVDITSDEDQMAQWLVQHGPISVGINAAVMKQYNGGISHPSKDSCDPENLTHAVLIVGYGSDFDPTFQETLPYWTIKNSWGLSWGEQGYYRVYRGDGTCGVNRMVSSAIVA